MSKYTKIWLITAVSLVLLGCILFVGVMTMLKWDFKKLATLKYESNTYTISEVFGSISVNTDTADITFKLSDDGRRRVECYEQSNAKHSVYVKDGVLNVEANDKRSFLDYIGINFGSPKVTVYLPKTEYTSLLINESTGNVEIPEEFAFKTVDISLSTGDVNFFAKASGNISIKTSTGDICVKNISAVNLELSVSTGNITATGVGCDGDLTVGVSTGKAKLTDTKCKNLISKGSTGDITLKNVIATEKFLINRSTGDVKFDRCDASEIFVQTDTGDVTGSLRTDKVFITKTDTGNADVPKTITGGKCEITTDTGNIKITIEK